MDTAGYDACVAWCVETLEYPISRTYRYELGAIVGRVFLLIARWQKEQSVRDTLTTGDRYAITMEVFSRLGARVLFEDVAA